MSKWTNFPALGAAPATTDILGLIDVSDTTDDAAGSNKKMTVANLFTSPTITDPTISDGEFTDASLVDPIITGFTGWQLSATQPSYTSVDDPTGVITFSGVDMTSLISVGMRIQFVNNGNTINGIVTAISFSTDTTLTFLHEIDPSDSLALTPVTNNPITVFKYSNDKCPVGFPIDPRKWTVYVNATSNNTQSSPTTSTWYNLGSNSLVIPIGAWRLGYDASTNVNDADTDVIIYMTLSSANNTESDITYTSIQGWIGATSVDSRSYDSHTKEVDMVTASKITRYLNVVAAVDAGALQLRGALSTTRIYAICNYL